MELDYIENINGLDENVVRLYNFNKSEAIQFRGLLKDTIIDKRKKLDLSEVDFITPRNCNLIFGLFTSDEGILTKDNETRNCNLIFGLFTSDEGILTKDNETFFCILTLEGFTNMVKLITPFCNKESKGFQYLYDIDNPTELLFSPSASLIEE